MENVIPDFQGVTSFEDIQKRFIAAARSIILEHKIFYDGHQFDITALELYLKLHQRRDLWWDPATDEGAKEQFNRGTWYVRQKKGPAYWRIDITAGNVTQNIQSGILIRQLNYAGGPASALHAIVRGGFGRHRWKPEEIALIERIHGKRIDGTDGSPLKLKRRSSPLNVGLGKGKRINLPASNAKNRDEISIRDAALRVSIWRKDSADEMIVADNNM